MSHDEHRLEMQFMPGESERDDLFRLLTWCYGKLHYRSFDSLDDALALDEIKLMLTMPALPVPEPQLAAADRAPSTLQADEKRDQS